MKLRLLLVGLAALPLLAQETKEPERHAAPVFDAAHAQRPAKSMRVKPEDSGANLNSLSAFEIFTNLVIPPGKTLNLFGQLDWTGASTASIAMACPASTSLLNVGIAVYWQMPGFTSTYTGTTALLGSNFLFTNMGGGVVPVFGNNFGLQITNFGSTTVACDQLTVYGVVH